jgi:monoamine oxidase
MVYDVCGKRWRAEGTRLTEIGGFWDELEEVMGKLSATRTPDRSFQDFLATNPGGPRLARARSLAREFVEGFQAADPALVSERALADGGMPEDEEEQRMGRIIDGYDRVPQWLARDLGSSLMSGVAVSRIDWRKGEVRLTLREVRTGATTVLSARAAVVSVPQGVLLAEPSAEGAIEIVPEPVSHMRAVRLVTMGHARRVVLAFSERFWETRPPRRLPKEKSLSTMSFLQSTDAAFPVWWTMMPLRESLLTGWAGGPRAAAMAGMSGDEITALALASIARQLGVTRKTVEGVLTGAWTHDWSTDPWSRGAYSYALVGGSDAAKTLARSVDGTLFFAGEATDAEGRNGTVHGAIASGYRAAGQVQKALGSRR